MKCAIIITLKYMIYTKERVSYENVNSSKILMQVTNKKGKEKHLNHFDRGGDYIKSESNCNNEIKVNMLLLTIFFI